MAEYIERQKVIDITAETGALETQRRVQEIPAADVVPAVQGKWNIFFEFPGGACWKCSVCGRVIEAHNLQNPILRFPYCHCGAKMESAYIIAGTDLEESK